MPRGGVQVVSLVEHFGYAQVRHASGRRRMASFTGDLQGLLVDVQCRIQVAPREDLCQWNRGVIRRERTEGGEP